MIQNREYQQNARFKINELANAGRNPLFVSPTGTGKTKTAILVIADRLRMGRRLFVTTPQEEIHNQWLTGLHEMGIDAGYINSHGVRGRQKQVYICMDKSLRNNLPFLERIKPHDIIIDEAHHSGAETYEAIFKHFGDARRIGLTATPYRFDNRPLGKYFTDMVETITTEEAIAAGFLAKPLLIVPETYKKLFPIPEEGEKIELAKRAREIGDPEIIGDIIDQYGKLLGGKPVIVACSSFNHAEAVTALFNAAGWQFEQLTSKSSKTDRRATVRKIKAGQLNGVCTVGIGVEGMDIPGLYGLIWMRRTLSLTIYLQFIGRVLRPLPGKTHGIIIDAVGNVFLHGLPEMRRKWSLDTDYKEAEPEDGAVTLKACPCCTTMNATANELCHLCGFDFSVKFSNRKYPRMVDGNLVFLDKAESENIDIKKLQAASVPEPEPERDIGEVGQLEKMNILKSGLLRKKTAFRKHVGSL